MLKTSSEHNVLEDRSLCVHNYAVAALFHTQDNALRPFPVSKIKTVQLNAARNSTVALFGKSQLRQSRATQATVPAGCFIVSIIHRTLIWTTAGFLAWAQMLMHAIAHRGVRTP